MTTATQTDYYELLGVSPEASAEEIQRTYRELAKEYHPDKTGGDKVAEEKMKEINAAYDVLKNAEKRKQYDAMRNGFSGFGGSGFGGFGPDGFGVGGEFDGASSFDDILGAIFGAGSHPATPRPQRGADLETTLSISFREAVKGTKGSVRLRRREECGDCHGSGAAPGSTPEPCRACHGTGRLHRAQGAFSVSQTCAQCGGAGTRVSTPCARCGGAGWVRAKRELALTVPPGVHSGARLRLAGEGEPGEHGGPRGDLYVRILVEPDEFFARDGDDIVCEVPVPFHTAALGGTVRVPTLTGTADLSVPASTQSGTGLRMAGLGAPRPGGGRGDQIVRILVEVPTRLTRKQRDLIEQMAAPGEVDQYPLHRRFTDKLKRATGACAAFILAVLLLAGDLRLPGTWL